MTDEKPPPVKTRVRHVADQKMRGTVVGYRKHGGRTFALVQWDFLLDLAPMMAARRTYVVIDRG